MSCAGSLYSVVVMMGGVVSATQAPGLIIVLLQGWAMPGPHTRKSRPRLCVCELKSAMRVPLPYSTVRQYSTCWKGGTFCTKMSAESNVPWRGYFRSLAPVYQRFSHCSLITG